MAAPPPGVSAEYVTAVRRFLADVAPHLIAEFDGKLGQLLADTSGRHDFPHVREVVLSYAGEAALYADPLTDDERAALDRARAGDLRGLRVLEANGSWRTL